MDQLNGKVALVTGASRGIGRAIAEKLASAGAKVVINYMSNQAHADEAVASIREQGGEAIAVQADVSRKSEMEELFHKTREHFGALDILVNNAGVGIMKPLDAITEEEFDRSFLINVKGTFLACQLAMKHMNEGGSIINFSTSVLGQMIPAYSLYAGTKGAVEQFTRQLAKEFGPKNITINAIAPGPVNTSFFTTGKSEELINHFKTLATFGRLGEPEDISGIVLFLAGSEARWITGQTLRANGGFI